MTDTDSMLHFLRALEDQHFWGAVLLKYENGKLVHIQETKNIKPNQLSDNRREHYNAHCR